MLVGGVYIVVNAGEYYPLLGMEEDVRQKLVDDHFLFMSGDKVSRSLQVIVWCPHLKKDYSNS